MAKEISTSEQYQAYLKAIAESNAKMMKSKKSGGKKKVKKSGK